jgi:TolA-binding protein
MMKRLFMMAFAATTLAASVVPANAQFAFGGGGVNGTEARLQTRINAGIRSGALTRNEASRLQSKMQQISQLEMRLRNSGNGLSWRERQRLQDKLNDLSNDINRQLSDSERNFNGYRRGYNRGGGYNNGGHWHH